MILGPIARANLPLLTKQQLISLIMLLLLGMYIDSNVSWTIHVDSMVKKATHRLYILKQLKGAGLTSTQLYHYYSTVIRPVLEYCAPIWQYALTKAQTRQLEAIQKRAIQIVEIVLNFSRDTVLIHAISCRYDNTC